VIVNQPPLNTPLTSANNNLQVRFPTVAGTNSLQDAFIDILYYVADTNGAGVSVINHTNGDDITVMNVVNSNGSRAPTDPRDSPGPVTASATNIFTAMSTSTQKSVANITDSNNSPGDTLEYTVQFQVSDYFTLGNM
jgi:hypothetical protein